MLLHQSVQKRRLGHQGEVGRCSRSGKASCWLPNRLHIMIGFCWRFAKRLWHSSDDLFFLFCFPRSDMKCYYTLDKKKLSSKVHDWHKRWHVFHPFHWGAQKNRDASRDDVVVVSRCWEVAKSPAYRWGKILVVDNWSDWYDIIYYDILIYTVYTYIYIHIIYLEKKNR